MLTDTQTPEPCEVCAANKANATFQCWMFGFCCLLLWIVLLVFSKDIWDNTLGRAVAITGGMATTIGLLIWSATRFPESDKIELRCWQHRGHYGR
jgi:tetrahydromethanopterin S-methyltransferase subunit E